MVGLALLLLHFQKRRPPVIVAAGCILGLGIVAMHYIGMAGMQLCRPVYGVLDIVISTAASLVLSTLAIWVAYDARTHRNILLGTVCFGLAVVSMHFVAIGLTEFTTSEATGVAGPALDNQVLAMGVTVSVFLICGAFLLTGITFFSAEEDLAPPASPDMPEVSTPPEPAPITAPKAGVPLNGKGRPILPCPKPLPPCAPRDITPCFMSARRSCSAPGPSPRRQTGWRPLVSCGYIGPIW